MFLFACLVLVVPWFWWQAVQADSSRAIDTWYTFSNYKSWNILLNFTPEQKFRVLLTNLLSLIFSPISLLNMKVNAVGFFISMMLTLLTFLGFIRDMRQNVRSLHLFILFYFGTIIMWVWPPVRFLLPMVPFLLFFAYKEFSRICSRVIKSGTIITYFSMILIVLLGIQMIHGLLSSTRETIKRQAVSFVPPMYQQDDWAVMKELFDWIQKNTPQDSILLGNLDPTYYLYTRRKAARGFATDPYLVYYSDTQEPAPNAVPDLVKRIAGNRVRYIIRTPSSYFRDAEIFNGILDRFISCYPEALHLVKEGSDPSYRVYEVDQGKLPQALP